MQWRAHPITMLMNSKRMFKTVLLKILPRKSDACVFRDCVWRFILFLYVGRVFLFLRDLLFKIGY